MDHIPHFTEESRVLKHFNDEKQKWGKKCQNATAVSLK
jgi:hypothetical protein